MQNASISTTPQRVWLYWAAFLSVIYVGVSLAGLGRTLDGNETWALYYAVQPLSEQFRALRTDLVHTPLIYLVERAWLMVFGQSDTAVKMLPMVVNVPTIFLFTRLASSVTTYWRLASFLFASAYFQVGGDLTQVRMYGLALLLTVIGMILWERWRENPTNANLAAWAVTMVLLIHTHLFGSLIVTAFVFVNWFFGPRRIAFTGAGAAVGVAILPWLMYVFPVYRARGLEPNLGWVKRSSVRGLMDCPLVFAGSPPIPIARGLLALAGCCLFLTVLLAAWRVFPARWQALKERDVDRATRWFWVAMLLTGVPILALFLFSVTVTPSFSPRFVFGVVPGMWLIFALLAQFGGRWPRVVLYGLFIPWVLVSAAGTVAQSRIPSQSREAAMFLVHEMRPRDMILCDGLNTGKLLKWEWGHRLGGSGRFEILRVSLGIYAHYLEYPGPPETSLNDLDLGGIDRVLFCMDRSNPNSVSLETVKAFLAERGYVLGGGFPDRAPFVLTFTKSG